MSTALPNKRPPNPLPTRRFSLLSVLDLGGKACPGGGVVVTAALPLWAFVLPVPSLLRWCSLRRWLSRWVRLVQEWCPDGCGVGAGSAEVGGGYGCSPAMASSGGRGARFRGAWGSSPADVRSPLFISSASCAAGVFFGSSSSVGAGSEPGRVAACLLRPRRALRRRPRASSAGKISPYPEDDMLGIEPLELHFPFELNKQISCSLKLTNQTDGYIAFNIQKMSPLPYCMKPEKDIVPPGASYNVDITLQAQDNVPRDRQRADKFTVWSTKVADCLAPEGITTDMFSKESAVVDAVNLDVFFGAEESTKEKDDLAAEDISTDMLNKDPCGVDVVSDADVLLHTQKRLKSSNVTPICLPLEFDVSTELTGAYGAAYKDKAPRSMLRANKFIVRSTEVNDGLTSEDITTEMSNKGADNAVDKVIQGSSVLLDVHPVELPFRFEPNKLIPCSLNLSNNTVKPVAFGLLEKSGEQTCFLRRLPMLGIVDPGTTYTLVVMMNAYENLPQERNVDLILQTSTYYGIRSDMEACMRHFQNAEELGNIVHRMTLKGVCALHGETIFEIISMVDIGADYLLGMDANQTAPLIITSSYTQGYTEPVQIWNSDTQKCVGSIHMPTEGLEVMSVKFIARMGWFLAGTNDGSIHVCNYKKEMQNITSIQAHGSYFKEPNTYIPSLAIHPTESYVLSACYTKIKLWDWDHRWKCMRTFKEHSDVVCALSFNPEDYKSFASASRDWTIKVWSLDSPKSMYTLSGHSHWVTSVDFFTRNGQQYLITGSYDKTAKIWDMQKKEYVHTLPHRSWVHSVLPHPKLPVLVTGTEDGHVYLWSSINFRLKRILDIGGQKMVTGLACLIESGRLVVAHLEGVSVIEICDEEEQGDSSGNNENSISATD